MDEQYIVVAKKNYLGGCDDVVEKIWMNDLNSSQRI